MEVLERAASAVRAGWARALGSLGALPALPCPAHAPGLQAVSSAMSRLKLPPPTRENVLYYYIPLQGACGYTALSVSVMNPHLMLRLFPRHDITNILLLSASGGAGMWLWARPHMAAASPTRRFSWAVLGGTLWSLGSILLWAILRSSVGRRPVLGSVLGITLGGVLTHTAIDYFHYIEIMFCGDIHLPEETYEPNSDDEKYDIDI